MKIMRYHYAEWGCDVYTAKITCRLSPSLGSQSKSRTTSKKWRMILMTHTSRRLSDQLRYGRCRKTVPPPRLHRLPTTTPSVGVFVTPSYSAPATIKTYAFPPLIPNHHVPITSKTKRQKIRAANFSAGPVEQQR